MGLSVRHPSLPVPSCHAVHPGEGGESISSWMNGSPARRDLAAQEADRSSSFTCKGSTAVMNPGASWLLP